MLLRCANGIPTFFRSRPETIITYEAPVIYYFAKYADAYGKIADSGALAPPAKK